MSQQAILNGPTSYAMDASALLALFHNEPGLEIVEASVAVSVISSVNWAEVLQKIIARSDREPEDVVGELEYLGLAIVPFTADDAERVARLWSVTPRSGLSFGDRACLSLAKRMDLAALTADRRWASLNLDTEVRLIR